MSEKPFFSVDVQPIAGQDVTVSLWKICYETQTSDAGEEGVGGAASDDKARELRDDNGRGIVTRNDKSVFALGRVSKNWISRAVDARRKVAAIDPFRHQELKLVLYAHANKEAEKAAPDAIVRFRWIVRRAVRNATADDAMPRAAISGNCRSPRIGAAHMRADRTASPPAIVEGIGNGI